MKKVLSIILIAILLIAGLFVLTGCGENKDKEEAAAKQELNAYAGTYKGEYTKFVGDSDKNKVKDKKFSLELKADGTGVSNRDDEKFDINWSLDGENFKMTEKFLGMTIEYTGTLKNGKLDIFNGDPKNDLTCEYVYSK